MPTAPAGVGRIGGKTAATERSERKIDQSKQGENASNWRRDQRARTESEGHGRRA